MSILKKIQYKIQWFYKVIFQCCYKATTIFRPIQQNKVVIPLYRHKKLEGNIKAVYEELKKTQPQLEFQFIIPNNKMNLRQFKEIAYISNAKYILLDDYYLPVYLIKPRKGTSIVQLWHAAGAFKKFGYSTVDTKFGPSSSYLKIIPIHSHYTHVFVSSKNMIPYYAEAFHMSEERIYPIGVPRIDFFADEKYVKKTNKKVLKSLTKEQQQMVKILVAPTYRAANNYRESDLDMVEEILAISKQIEKDKLIIFAGHPYMEESKFERLQKQSNIIMNSQFSANDWMPLADAFITDYSSAIFEFGLLQKPLAHYVPDLEEYKKSRGLYNEIETISDGPVLQKRTQLIEWINERKASEHFDTSRMVRYNFSKTKGIAKEIVEQLLKCE
ncbi:CDP-glycerol glycerophosphotransferase family protein [Rummeliibacillus sp. POC4]|uniref:CDP-glycerol glycerophosphotransferase family protein n=1 Tax=Rummeliibacillus sp. POC4 TaxID=2305899 RepID=UPI000E66A7B0|nr:CDP-glycerol glycerophosphotransferase family protein [Rummeliibacillus sp. POC4]RIJ69534.1 CDP-glycerol glycerophosphotransferase family protein [Rummeliibacillus sp. POC4]